MDFLSNVDIIAAASATVALFFTGYTFLQDQKTRQLQMADDLFKNLRELENQYYEKYINKDDEEKKHWRYIFFNTIEWFSFLINNNKFKDKKMLTFFEDALIAYYDEMFVKLFDENVIRDENQFPEFKNLYKKLKK
jgi:hypothetical protein